jgi:hypothetical protein
VKLKKLRGYECVGMSRRAHASPAMKALSTTYGALTSTSTMHSAARRGQSPAEGTVGHRTVTQTQPHRNKGEKKTNLVVFVYNKVDLVRQ